MKKIQWIVLLILIALPVSVTAKKLTTRTEASYAKEFCNSIGGAQEVYTLDKTRIDCATSTTAWEVEFAHKWYEAVGQSHYYAAKTHLKPGIALIIKTPSDHKYANRLLLTQKYWKWDELQIKFIGETPFP